MPSKINAGRVGLTLDGEPFILEPTLRAITEILWHYGDFAPLYAQLLAQNIDAVAFVVRCGLGGKSNKIDPAELLYRNGLTEEVLASLIEFVAVLANGGKPPAADTERGWTQRDKKMVSLDAWCDRLLQQATGWLGYTPEVALSTPIGQLELALDGRMEFLRKTNPWRSQKDIDDEQLLEQMEAGAGREQGARAIIGWIERMKRAQADTSRTIEDE